MLNDWLWAIFLVIALWLEVGGWARLITRVVLPTSERARLGTRLSCALGFACVAQFHFLLSLLGRSTPAMHVALAVTGIGLAVAPRMRGAPRASGESRLHLKLARSFSPLLWKRSWPWLALPIAWLALRIIDALLPHGSQAELSYNLLAPRQWLEGGGQRLDPLHPLSALAAVWEGLYYHAFALVRAAHPVSRSALVRGQLVAQLIHLTAGQFLAGLVLARLIEPFVRTGWDALVHADASPSYRHRMGMASSVAMPAALFFAWVACGQSQTGALAANEWGSAMMLLAALAFVSEGQSPLATGIAGFLWGSATAAHFSAGLAGTGLLAALVVANRSNWRATLPARLGAAALGAAAGLSVWLVRNWSQAGELFYPHSDLIGEKPGWFSDLLPMSLAAPDTVWPRTLWVILIFGLPALGFYLWKARQRVWQGGMAGLLAFLAAGAITAIGRNELDLATGAALAATALVGLEFGVTLLRRPLAAELGRYIPLAWLAAGLFAVPLPFHLLWQDLPQVFRPVDSVLAQVVSHFDAKLWASVSLPRTVHVAWTSDTEFYYLEQPAASIRESSILHDALARAGAPADRVAALCELGFDVLAWEDRGHGTETAGLGAWLRLTKSAILHASDDVTLFDLRCAANARQN